MISLHVRRRYVPFVVGAALWLYLNRAAIAVNISFVHRSSKGVMVAYFKRLKSFFAELGARFAAGIQSCWQCLGRRGGAHKQPSVQNEVELANDNALL
jgi:hypothetical protein